MPHAVLNRRALLAGLAAFPLPPAAAALAVPDSGSFGFEVTRLGSRIGTHTVHFSRATDGLSVRAEVDLLVRFALIPVFRYRQRVDERWQGDRLAAFSADTDNDGTPLAAAGHLERDGLVVEGSKAPRYVAPPTALPTTYWNRRLLEGPMISTQDGRLFMPAVSRLGVDPVTLPSGPVQAEHFTVSGDMHMNLWYAAAEWVGFQFAAKDGSQISYRRL